MPTAIFEPGLVPITLSLIYLNVMSEEMELTNAAPEAAKDLTAAQSEISAAAPAAAEVSNHPRMQTKDEILAKVRQYVADDVVIDRAELDHFRIQFYRLVNAEQAAAREAFEQQESEAALQAAKAGETAVHHDFVPAEDPMEQEFKAAINTLKERRAAQNAAIEEEKRQNLERKQAIIARIKAMTEDPEGVEKSYDEFKQLQTEWKERQAVPAENATELWKNYQLYVEQFYDLLRLSFEFRAYDFKKNLEAKTHLIEAAEKLAEVEDPISAFHQLQKLHEQWRETGPVAKELREEIWARFKAASTVINKRHQDHFLAIKEQEEANLASKTALCELVEAIDTTALTNLQQWEESTKAIAEAQAQWKTIGYTPRKVNASIFERFRTACDKFFQAKSAHFKGIREEYAANLEKKTALCEKAESLKDSTDWTATANALIALQKEWKQVGPVAHKYSDALWHRFNDACNFFFAQKQEAGAGQRAEEEANLERKQDIIARLEALLQAEEEDLHAAVKALQTEWSEVGHVPFRKKERIYQRYREACDAIYDRLKASGVRRRMENFRKNVIEKGGDVVTRESQRLQRAYEEKKAEIQNYETNLTFLNVKSKSASGLVADIERRIARLKEELEEIKQKLAATRE